MRVLFLFLVLSGVGVSAQTARFTNSSSTFDVVFDSGPCGEDRKCGPISLTLYKKRSKIPVQRIVAGRVEKSDLDHPIQFIDFNFDGVKDLEVNDGFRSPAGLGIEALRIYLYSPVSKSFVYNSELSDISQSEGISSDRILRKLKQIETYARPGGGYFRWRRYTMTRNKPVMVYELTSDETAENGTVTLVTTKKFIKGRWRTWTKRYKSR
ncbi:MAG: XAC2610-related protein [Pyrinomonadaceae bacterium]